MRRLVLLIAILAAARPAQAVEVGDVVWLSSNGVSLAVTEMHRVDRKTVSLTAQQMATNASESRVRPVRIVLVFERPGWRVAGQATSRCREMFLTRA